MKVYVSELPKSCEKCKFYECETELVGEWGMENHRHICKINGSLIQGICPLQSLTDYTKQVRKEMVQEIRELIKAKKGIMIGRYNYQTAQHDEVEIVSIEEVNNILENIEK